MTNLHPHSRTDIEEITARNITALHVIAGSAGERS